MSSSQSSQSSQSPPSEPNAGRHELGQNHLVDPAVIDAVVDEVAATEGPIVEWAAGGGALTVPLARLGRPLQAVELDASAARRLARRVGPHVCIEEGDILRHAPPRQATVVGNIPFHITTPVLRHLFAQTSWQTAVLITQWEVARKRAGVGGATQLTAQWWPWLDVALRQRIAASAFRPRPSVDAGLLVISRRAVPLVNGDGERYRRWVQAVFTGRGRGLADILAVSGQLERAAAQAFCASHQLTGPRALPRALTAHQWAEAYGLSRTGTSRRGRR